MNGRSFLAIAGTLLAVATLVVAGYELTQRFQGEHGLLSLLPLVLSVATALLCIGILDWAHGLEQQSGPAPEKPERGAHRAPERRAQRTPAAVREAELVAPVQALERLADDERGTEQTISEALTTVTNFARASAGTLWMIRRPELDESETAASDAAPASASAESERSLGMPELELRAHRESDRVYLADKMPQPEPPEQAWRQAAERREVLQTVGEANASFLVPLVAGRECVGLLKLVVPQGGSPEERQSAAQNLAGDLSLLGRAIGRAVKAPGIYDQAVRDSLTGLYTRRHFVSRLNDCVAASRRYGGPLALALVGIDDFQRVNRRYGQATGNRLLRAIAALVLDNIRDCDSAYRYGGDQIALILPNTDVGGARSVAERLCRTFRATRGLADDGSEIIATASAGVTEFDEDTSGIAPLMKRAERALYAAKAAGHGRVEQWNEEAGHSGAGPRGR